MSHPQNGSSAIPREPTPQQRFSGLLGYTGIAGITTAVVIATDHTGSFLKLLILIVSANMSIFLIFYGFSLLLKSFRRRSRTAKSYIPGAALFIIGVLVAGGVFIRASQEATQDVPPPGSVENNDTDALAIRSLRDAESDDSTALSATIINRRDHPLVLKRIYWVIQANTTFQCPKGMSCLADGERYLLDSTLFSMGDGRARGALAITEGSLEGFQVDSEVVLSRGYSKVFEVGFNANLTIPANETYDMVLVLPLTANVIAEGDPLSGWYGPSLYSPDDEPNHTPYLWKSNSSEIQLCLDGTPKFQVFATSTESDQWASSSIWLKPSSQLRCEEG